MIQQDFDDFHNSKCAGNFKAISFIVSINEIIFICDNSFCPCFKKRGDMKMYNINEIINTLINKQSQGWQNYLSIIEYYNNCIKTLELQRDKLKNKINNQLAPILTIHEINLLSYLQNQTIQYPNQQWVEKIKSTLEKQKRIVLKDSLNEVLNTFMDVCINIQALWQDPSKLQSKDSLIECSGQNYRQLFMDQFVKIGSFFQQNKMLDLQQISYNNLNGITGLYINKKVSTALLYGFAKLLPNIDTICFVNLNSNFEINIKQLSLLSGQNKIKKMQLCKNITTSNHQTSIEFFTFLATKFPSLQSLKITVNKMSQSIVKGLSKCPLKFKQLIFIVGFISSQNAFKDLQLFHNLNSFELYSEQRLFKIQQNQQKMQFNYSYLSKLFKLKSLKTNYSCNFRDIDIIGSNLKQLQSLTIILESFNGDNFNLLGKLKHLVKCSISYYQLNNNILDQNIIELINNKVIMQQIQIINCRSNENQRLFQGRMKKGCLSNYAIGQIVKNSSLKILNLKNQIIRDYGAKLISENLPLLQTLDLSQNTISNTGLVYISKLANLQNLQIGQSCKISFGGDILQQTTKMFYSNNRGH